MKTINQRTVEHLEAAKVPSHLEDMRVCCGVGNWNTALKHCLELLLAKRIERPKTKQRLDLLDRQRIKFKGGKRMNQHVEFLVKLRDASQLIADAANQYIETLAPPEVKAEAAAPSERISLP